MNVQSTYQNRLEWVGLLAGIVAIAVMLTGCAMQPTDPGAGQTVDTDGDGVPNATDLCLNTPAAEVGDVNSDGCGPSERDTDGDGVVDANDQCSNTPANTTVDASGCATSQGAPDADSDGVADANDTCPNTPAAEASNVDANGCAPSQHDTDGDGVSDAADRCANTPAGATVDANGCTTTQAQTDSDGDGVLDPQDTCPNTPAAETGDIDANGCGPSERDTDGDGVVDANDHCPGTPAGTNVDATGCRVTNGGGGGGGGGTTPVCGNGAVESGEDCEPPNTSTCDANCQTIAVCGNSIVEAGEQCDPPGTATCDANCQTIAVCGNSVIEAGEQCDPPGQDNCGDNCLLSVSFNADACADATPISGEGLIGFDNTAATLDGPGHAACVSPANQDNFEDNMAADVWACWTAPCDGTVFADTCGRTVVDTKIAVYEGCDCPATDSMLRACNDDGCDLGSRVTFDVVAGHEYLIRVGTFADADPGVGAISLACGLEVCGSSTDSCTTAHDTSGCSDATCCESVCALDPYCCDSTSGGWDDTCVTEAGGLCSADGFAVCGVSRNGLCTDPAGTGTPGCRDGGCCNTVCAIDAYCCTNEWDDTCATEAAQYCQTTCGDGAGDCFAANGTAGCEAPECCADVCIRDPFCCGAAQNGVTGTWDDNCVQEAQGLCAP